MKEIKSIVEKYSKVMEDAEQYIWDNPEVGYKEFKTNDYMIAQFEKLGYKVERFDGITGFTTYYDTGKKGATVLVLAELDSLICYDHPECDKQTGAVHNCGHNVQCASILGVAGAIIEKAVNQNLSGKVKFAIVPAEEGIEISYRMGLIEKGVISFTSGKPECIKRGLLDDVDVAFMIHGTDLSAIDCVYKFSRGDNGVVRKKTIIKGKASHAGANPWDGVNALYAAELVFSATNALRETFKEEDYIRFHSIITKGGEAVNAIPEEIVIESYVRGASPKAIREANKKINRAITGACLSMGAEVTITDIAGSNPRYEDEKLSSLMQGVAKELVGENKYYVDNNWTTSSTDMGDVSCLVPSVHAYIDSNRGLLHGKNYQRIHPVESCVNSATLQTATLVELLKNNSEKAFEIKKNFKPTFNSVEEYLKVQYSISKTYNPILYDGDEIKINL